MTMLTQQQERTLVEIYNKHFVKIYRYFYYKILDSSTCEDLASDTFLRFAENVRDNYNSIEDHVKFLYGIANNVFLTHLRKKYDAQLITGIEWDEMAADEVDFFLEEIDAIYEKDDALERIAKLYIARLPEKQRVVLEMRLIKKMSLNEICHELGKDMNYVKTTQKRGIRSLKELVSCTPETT